MKELRRLFPYFKRYKSKFLLGFIFITLSNLCSTSIPLVVGSVIDTLSSGKFQQFGINIHVGSISLYKTSIETTRAENLWLHITGIILLTAGSGLFMFLTRRTIIVASRLIEYDVRNDFLLAIERQSLRFFHSTTTGSMMAHATNDVSAIREFIGPAVMYTANTITTFTFAIAIMASLNPSITFFALLPLPLIGFTTYYIGKLVHVMFRDVQEQFEELTSQAQESFSGVRVIRAYVREEFEAERFKKQSHEYLNRNMRLARAQSLSMPLMVVLVGISQIIVLGYGGHLVIQGETSLGVITQFFIYLSQLIWPVAAIGWVTNLVQRAAASTKRIGKILDESTDIFESATVDTSISAVEGTITFKNVSFKYLPEFPYALNDLSFSIPKGCSLGIVGSVGSGKSTLVNLLPRLYDISEGQILIDGKDIKTIPLRTLRNSIGVVPQESFLFSMSIENNIQFGRAEATMQEIIEASDIAQLTQEVEKFPEGFKTIVGERGITLSGGQKQRTSIARAVIRKPSILILDDALSAVDTDTEERILKGLKSIMSDRTTILISHRVSTVKNAEQIIVLDDGMIAESGTHETLLKLGGQYAEMYSRQLLEEEIEHFDE
jgi:ATP-binding cassette subfamily B protein